MKNLILKLQINWTPGFSKSKIPLTINKEVYFTISVTVSVFLTIGTLVYCLHTTALPKEEITLPGDALYSEGSQNNVCQATYS